MQRSDITIINNISEAIANPATGDVIYLDLDETLLLTGFNKFSDDPKLTESGLPDEISRLQERGIRVVGLTSRSRENSQATLDQLKMAGMQFEVLHAPDISSDDGSLSSGKGKALHADFVQSKVKPKRIFVFDNLRHHLDAVKTACEGLGVPLFLKHYVVPDYQPVHVDASDAALFPEKLDGYQKEKSLGGGTGSVFVLKHPGREQPLVLKLGAHEDSAKVEMLCNALYRILGVNVPKMRVYHRLPKNLAADLGMKHPYRFSQLCEFIKSGEAAPTEIIKKAARDNFVVHALLGNIDVAKEDNFIVDRDGKAFLIDAGANFIFRSLGQLRRESPYLLSELETLRDQSFNDKGPLWFGDLTDDEIRLQLKNILAKTNELVEAVWSLSLHMQLSDELRDKFLQCMADRIDVLVTRYRCHSESYAKVDKRAQEGKTAAGILTYAMKDGRPHILLSKRVRHECWDNFGGKSEAGDDSLLATARREVAEESGQLLNYTDLELQQSPFHDIVTGTRDQQIYRMYICQYNYIPATEFKDNEHSAHLWVPLQDIIDAVDAGEAKEFEGKKTVVVKTGRDEIPLYPPLFTMLQQLPVMESLRELQQSGQMKRRHTLSYAEKINKQEVVSEYRPLLTPLEKRQKIAATFKTKSRVIRQLKHDNASKPELQVKKISCALSQSEVHLKAMLGKEYKNGDLAANVRKFINMYAADLSAVRDEDQERLVQHCIALIETEKKYGDEYIYFYHACSNSIAFAYDVYTAIYQTLQQEINWSSFRPESEHLKRFQNITEFVAFYSDNGKHVINNNDNNYNDCALSANIFLFGNHDTQTSSSIHYLLKNDIRRQVDIAALFEELLQEFQISGTEIKRMLSVFDKYLHEQGGRLYQIGMPIEQARQMSYPAGCLGMMNTLNGDHELPSVLQKLREKVENNDGMTRDTHEYVQYLQARVMVPPHLKLSTAEVKWKPMAAADETVYRAALEQVVDAVVHKILCHHRINGLRSTNTPLLKVLPDILSSNQLSGGASRNDEDLMQAILADDVAMVKVILRDHPELLHKKVRVQRKYINFVNDANDDDNYTFLQMILLRKNIPLNDLIDFTAANWIVQLTADSSMYKFGLARVIKRIPAEHRLKMVVHQAQFIYSVNDVIKIIGKLPDKDRLVLANLAAPTIHSFGKISAVAALLSMPDKLIFLSNNVVSMGDLCELLKITPEDQRMEALNQHQALLDTVANIIHAMQFIPVTLRYDFVMQLNVKFTMAGICKIVAELPRTRKLEFILVHQDKIQDGKDVIEILSVLSSDEIADFVAPYQDKLTGAELAQVMTYLNYSKRSAFLSANEHKIKTGADVLSLLGFISVENSDRLDFLTRHQEKITDIKIIIRIAASLKQSQCLEFFKQHSALIEDDNDLQIMLAILPEASRGGFARLHQAVIKNEKNLSEIICMLSPEDSFAFAMDNISKLSNMNNIYNVLRHFNLPSQRYALAVACQESIMSSQEMDKLTYLLDKVDLIKFIAANIRDAIHLKYYLSLLSADRRVAAIVEYKHCIKSSAALQLILQALPQSERNQCVLEYQHFIKDARELLGVMPLLLPDEQLQLAKSKRQLIGDSYDLAHVLDAIRLEDRWSFALEQEFSFASGEDLERVVVRLPVDRRLSYARDKIINISTFEYALSQVVFKEDRDDLLARHDDLIVTSYYVGRITRKLPDAVRMSFAQRHSNKITSVSDLADILRALATKDRFAFAMACSANMSSFDNIHAITPLLAHDEVLFFLHANIKNFTTLNMVLQSTPEPKRLALAERHADLIQYFCQLENLLAQLSFGSGLACAMNKRHLITTYENMTELLPYFTPRQCLDFVTAHQDKITTHLQMDVVVRHLPLDSKLAFRQANVRNARMLYELLEILPYEDRLAATSGYQHMITTSDELRLLLSSLPGQDLLRFANGHLDKINSTDALLALVTKLLPEDRHDFIIANQGKMSDGKALGALASILKIESRFAFVMMHEDKISDGRVLRDVLQYIPRDQRFQFITRHQDKIETIVQLDFLARELDHKEAQALAVANFARFHDKYSDGDKTSNYVDEAMFSMFGSPTSLTYIKSLVREAEMQNFIGKLKP